MNKLNTMDNFKYRPIKELITFAKVFHDTDDCIEYVLSEFEKSKQLKPILTTEDGEEIYEGMEYYILNFNWNINKWVGGKYANLIMSDKTFSTKEKAEEYKLLNQPCLSFADLMISDVIFTSKDAKIIKDLATKKQNTHTVNHKQ